MFNNIPPCPSQTGEGIAVKEEEWRGITITFHEANLCRDFDAGCQRYPLELIFSSTTNRLLRIGTSIAFTSALRRQFSRQLQTHLIDPR